MPEKICSAAQSPPSLTVFDQKSVIQNSLIGVIGGLVWILASSWILLHLIRSHNLSATDQVAGWLFIIVAALGLGFGLSRYFRMAQRWSRRLQEYEERWKYALEGALLAVWDWNGQSNEVFYAPQWKAMLGYEAHEIGNTLAEWESRIHPDDLPQVKQAMEKLFKGACSNFFSEHRLRCRTGQYKWTLARGTITQYAPGGLALRVVGTHSDIDRRKRTEEALASSEERFRAIFDNSPDGALVIEAQERRLLFGNEAMCQMLGYTPEELPPLGIADLHPKEDLPRILAELENLSRDHRHFIKSVPVRRKDGSVFLADVSVSQFPAADRLCLMGLFRDITDRQQAEERNRLKHDLMLALAAAPWLEQGMQLCLAAALQVAHLDSGGFYLFNSRHGALELRIHRGLSPAFVNAVARYDSSSPQAKLVAAGQPVYARFGALPLEQSNSELEEGLKVIALIPISLEGRPIGCLNVASHTRYDICPAAREALETIAASSAQAIIRLQTQEALRDSEERFSTVFQVSPEAIGIMRLNDGCFVEANAAFISLVGYAREEMLGHTLQELLLMPSTHQEEILQSLLERKQLRSYETQLRTKSGEVREVLLSLKLMMFDGDPCVMGVLANISERRRMEEQLRESERQLATLLANLPGMAYRCQNVPGWPMVFVSEGCAHLTGYSAAHLMNCSPAYGDVILTSDRPMVWEGVQAALRLHKPFQLTYRIQAADGQLKWVWERGRGIFAPDGELLFLEGFIADISERKEIELGLRQSELRRRLAMEAAQMGAWEWDLLSGRQIWSDVQEKIWGYPPGAFPGTTEACLDRIHPEDLPGIRQAEERGKQDHKPYRTDFRVLQPDGTLRWVAGTGQFQFDTEGVAVRAMGVVMDITERKKTEQALAMEATRRRILVEGSRDGIVVLDQQGQVLEANRQFRDMLGYSSDEIRQLHVWDWDPRMTPEQVWEAIRVLGPAGDFFETCHRRKDGTGYEVEVSTNAAELEGQRLVFCVCRDITERKQAEHQAAREALRTEFLLELHQRAPQMTDRELYDHVLDRAVQLTKSQIGFFHQVSDDQRSILLTTWNQEALNRCTAPFQTHYPVKEAGNWVDCLRQLRPVVYNDYALSPNQGGLPPGHVPVRRFMSIPVVQDGKARIIFGVGNKTTDYDQSDVMHLQLVANELHKICIQRGAQNQLRQLSRAVQQSPASVLITDTSGAIEYVNPKFTQVTDYSLEEVRGRNPRILKSGETPGPIYHQLWETILEGREWHGELYNRKKNGELHWESASISAITDHTGKITHFLAVKEDITERKRLESFREALLVLGDRLNNTRDAREAGRALLESAKLLWPWDAATLDTLTTHGEQMWSVLNVDTIAGQRQELPARGLRPLTPGARQVIKEGSLLCSSDDALPRIADSAHGEDPNQLSASMMRVPIRRESEVLGILSIQSYSPKAYSPKDLQTLQALADYCGGALERIRSEEALRHSEERYRHLVETTNDWIWEVDAESRYTYVSPRITMLLGYSPGEVLGRTPFDLMQPHEAQQLSNHFCEIAAKRKPFFALEKTNVHKDGRQVVLESSGLPIVGHQGELLGYRGMDRDISERRRLESLLRQAQKLDAVGQLAGGVAHDFNNILAAIMMHLNLLQMNPDLDVATLQVLADLGEEAQRAASLTRQLLMFSRRSVLAVKPLDLNEVVAHLLKMLHRLIGEHIKLIFDGQTGFLPSVAADAGMLEQVVMNLVVNARDAMPKGGQITINTSVALFDESHITLNPNRQPGRFVCLTVSDTGIGMNEDTLKHIFEPFFTTKEVGKGTGLGLATVHGIVAQHKGWVEVISEVGTGTSFHVYLPSVSQEVPATDQKTPAEPLRRGREFILVVEDESSVRRAICRALRHLGYQVLEAENGQQAINLWQKQGDQVDLLLTDMVMPEGMTGLELIEKLQACQPGLQAIISSGYTSEMVRGGVPDKLGITYLPKPYEIGRLAEVIRNCLDRKPA